MKKIAKLLTTLLVSTLFACSDEEPDPRASYEGSFEMEDFDISATSSDGDLDTVTTISDNPEIEFEREEDLDGDELLLDVEDFLDDVIKGTIGELYASPETTITLDFDEEFVTEIDAEEFEVDDTDFTLIASGDGSTVNLQCEFEGEGELEGEELTLEYDIIVIGEVGNVTFSGTAVAVRD